MTETPAGRIELEDVDAADVVRAGTAALADELAGDDDVRGADVEDDGGRLVCDVCGLDGGCDGPAEREVCGALDGADVWLGPDEFDAG